jgi:uncharacterized OB-fold protein
MGGTMMTGSPALLCPELLRRSAHYWTLLGSRCCDCGELYFPNHASCSRCGSLTLQEQDLGNEGLLWSWTIQTFLPKAPCDMGGTAQTFRPYGVGYVELGCGLKVESRLVGTDFDRLRIGAPMVLTLDPYRLGVDGEPVHTFAFQLLEIALPTRGQARELSDGR